MKKVAKQIKAIGTETGFPDKSLYNASNIILWLSVEKLTIPITQVEYLA